MGFTRLAVFAAALAIVPVLPVHAQNDGDEIVIIGMPAERDALASFVGAVGKETTQDQLARWNQPVCPSVVGLRGDLNNYVAQTITAVAEVTGAGSARAGCSPNIMVGFLSRPSGFVGDLRDRLPVHFQSVPLRERARLADSGAPVISWSVTELASEGGQPIIQRDRNPIERDITLARQVGITDASRIQMSTRSDLVSTYILIDLDQLQGVTMRQLSAYVAMVALTASDPAQQVRPTGTILNLFHEREASPADFTDWDIAYLYALYATEPARVSNVQRSAIAQYMGDLLYRGSDR